MIVTDERALRVACAPVTSVSEGGVVARRLTDTLARVNKKATKAYRRVSGKNQDLVMGVGLSAPQIGVAKQVCLVRLTPEGRPWVLMNPVIVGKSEATVSFTEGCLSFPGVRVKTERHLWVDVDTLNLGRVTFGPKDCDVKGDNLLLSIAVQHEIAHLHGLLLFDFEEEALRLNGSPWDKIAAA